jgi:hypothetical protein
MVMMGEIEEEVFNLEQHLFGARIAAVHLVDHQHHGEVLVQGLGQDVSRLWQWAFRGVNEQEHTVDQSQGTFHLATEIRVPRCVDEVDLDPTPFHRSGLGKDGDSTFTFLVVVVHDTLHHGLMRGKGARLAQQLVDQRGFAMVNVRDDRDVTDEIVQEEASSLSAISPSSSNTTP